VLCVTSVVLYLVMSPTQSHVALSVQNLTIVTHYCSTSQPQHCKSYNVSRIISLVLLVALASYNGHQKTYCMSYTGYQSNSEFIIK